ncbi:MAG: histidine phosphatase family protein, partial [Candidatus Dormibacteraeota bacterium]|nr:histidine phosphatase family protein [Candidatus Dormibacteraeota bacterium]
ITDLPLSHQGRKQAQRLGAGLATRPLARVLSSDLKRALSTAHAIASRHRLAVDPTPALREIDFGAWEGRSLADLWSEDPQAARAWENDIRSTPSGFGESLACLQTRVEGWWRQVHAVDEGARGELAIVAHRCSLAALRAVITGETIEEAFSTPLDVGVAVAVMF